MNFAQVKKIETLIVQQAREFHKSGHDTTHLFRTRDNAINIAQILQVATQLDLNILQATCLLHDFIYLTKSRLPLPTFYRYIWEGELTTFKVRQILKKIGVVKDEQKIILTAIKAHPHSFPWKNLNKNKSLYSQILQDADTLDLFRENRERLIKKQDLFTKLISPFLGWSLKMGRKHQDLFLNFPELKIYFSAQKTFVYQKWRGEIKNLQKQKNIDVKEKSANSQKTKTILCLHGYANSHLMFKPFAQALSDNYEIISLQLPYWRFKQIFSVTELSRYVENFRQNLKLEEFILLGFSLGGVVATEYSLKHSKHIKQLILLNSLPQFLPSTKLIKIVAWIKPLLLSSTFLFFYTQITTNQFVRKLCHFPQLNQAIKKMMRRNSIAVFGTLFNQLNYAKIKEFNQLPKPKMVILFKDDEILKWKRAKKITQQLNAKIITKNTGGHATKENYWSEVARAI